MYESSHRRSNNLTVQFRSTPSRTLIFSQLEAVARDITQAGHFRYESEI